MSARGRKGGRRMRPGRLRSHDWLRGYTAGWMASERWFFERYEVRKMKPMRRRAA